MSNSQLNKLKSRIKNGTKVTETFNKYYWWFYWSKLLLTDTQVSKICKAFANGSSPKVKLSKTHLCKTRQSVGFLGWLLGPLLNIGMPLIRNVPKPLAKGVLILLGLATAVSATDTAIHKKMFGSGIITLIISNEEINEINI